MPLSKYERRSRDGELRRPDAKPLVYFKGTFAEAEKMSLDEIRSKLSAAGLDSVKIQIDQLKSLVISAMRQHLEKVDKRTELPATHILVPLRTDDTRMKFIPLKITSYNGEGEKRFLVTQHPALHGITGSITERGLPSEPSHDLIAILNSGFRMKRGPNVYFKEKRKMGESEPTCEESRHGDSYSIEMMAEIEPYITPETKNPFHATVESALPTQISAVNIRLNPRIPREEAAKRKREYLLELRKIQPAIAIRFI